MAIDLGASLMGTFALYGMLQVLKDVFVEVLGLAQASSLTGKLLSVFALRTNLGFPTLEITSLQSLIDTTNTTTNVNRPISFGWSPVHRRDVSGCRVGGPPLPHRRTSLPASPHRSAYQQAENR